MLLKELSARWKIHSLQAKKYIYICIHLNKVNFLYVAPWPKSGKHLPYTKEGKTNQSNHSPSILRIIPESINKRLLEISSDKDCLDKAKGAYQDARNKSDYKYKLSFKAPTPDASRKKR